MAHEHAERRTHGKKWTRNRGRRWGMNNRTACELVDLKEIMEMVNQTDHKTDVMAVRLNEEGDLELDTSFPSARDVPRSILDVAKNVKGMAAGKKVVILTDDGTATEISPD
jgi:hypothetical protein